jgi:hypothetical protein
LSDIDKQITDAFGLVGLLLVFVFSYFSAVLPHTNQLLETSIPEVIEVEQNKLKADCRTRQGVLIALITVVILIFVLLIPLLTHVLADWHWVPFDTVRAGLAMVEVFLLLMASYIAWLVYKLQQKIVRVNEKAAKHGRSGARPGR